jgi:hypothetical protein
MPTYRLEHTNFQAGELDPNFHSRSDLKLYDEGAKQVQNFYLMLTGGVMRRPGTTYLANLGAASRIHPFLFSGDERHIVAFQASGAKIYGIDGTLQATLTGAPWGADDLFELNITQAGDAMIIVHRDYQPTQITRTGATTFTRADYAFEGDSSTTHKRPFFKYVDAAVTLTPSGTSGSITLTASADTWETAHNGTILEYTDTAGTVHQMELGSRVSATVINATVLHSTTLPNTTAVKTWREQMYSAVRGWPGATSFHDNRLWFGGNSQRPGGLVGSQSGAFFNFDLGDGEDDESVDITIAGSSVNEIRHLVSTRRLEILTDTGEFYLSDSDVRTITPSNVSVRRQTTYGTSRTPPIFFDGQTVFVQRSGQNLRAYAYDFVRDTYASDLLSVKASHLVLSPRQIASTFGTDTRPEQYLLFVNSDGTLTYYHSIREQDVQGFAQWSTRSGDTFESACGVAEDMFVVVKRTLNSSTVYALERLEDDDAVTLDCSAEGTRSQYGTPLVDGASQTGTTLNIDGLTSTPYAGDQFTIAGVTGTYTIDRLTYSSGDAALVLTSALASSPADNAAITFTTGHLYSGLSHLANETVHVVSNNLYLGTETVSGSGTITIDYAGQSDIRAGFSYTPTLETMPVVFESRRGKLNGVVRRITRCLVDITGGYDIKVEGNQLAVRQVNDDMSLPLQAQAGHFEFPVMGYSREPTITLTQTDPLPLRVLGIGVEVRAY